MVVNHFIEQRPSGVFLTFDVRDTAAKDYKRKMLSFIKEQDARRALKQKKQEVFVKQLCAFINNAKRIIDNSNFPPRRKAESLRRCVDLMKFAKGQYGQKRLGEMCKFTLMNRSHLQRIIPHPNNVSHITSQKNFHDIIEFAKKESGKKYCTQI